MLKKILLSASYMAIMVYMLYSAIVAVINADDIFMSIWKKD